MGKHKLARFAENLTFSNLIQVGYDQLEAGTFEWRGRWADYFKNDNPIVLELGCGKGDYTIALAKQDATRNYIGVDIKGARLWRGAKTATEEAMPNVAFIRTRIELIDRFFAPNEVSEIWITFPDPQPKKPNKRLTSPRFLELYRHMVRPGSLVHLKTDSLELHRYTVDEVVRPLAYPIETATDDLYASSYEGEAKLVQTFYEQMFLSQGKPITYLKFRLP
ncbi:MAG: tRNA (guanosine(46)-N7)-methyltransferase TrmB [Bacteroidaceae bacterium]|nr:tRNA (guanosine(46)-N7)-methyltransferase TrmB [Bacteroidales bacterium]MBR1755320.1 tRNA (guanosine(46)-N7)-methyltransferase TrmB [Bacteroidaceae bacterium]